jgi:hypothetical protein
MTTKIIVLGSSGATGKEALAAALASPSISSVFSFGRRSPPVDNLSGANKLTHANLDFEKLLLGKGNAEYEAEAKKLREVGSFRSSILRVCDSQLTLLLNRCRRRIDRFGNYEEERWKCRSF